MATPTDLRDDNLRHPLDIGGSLICGATFDTTEPCDYGERTHQCWQDATCTGIHVCCCEAVPDYVKDWLDNHEDATFELALGYLTVEDNGAVVCGCCGVNYNIHVNQD